MCIPHGHGDGGVAQDLLQHQDVAAVHHKVAGEGVSQNVGILPRWQFQPCPFDHHLEGTIAVTKQTAALSGQLGIELGADGYAATLLALGTSEGDAIGGYLGLGQLFHLRPTGAGGQAEFNDQQQVGIWTFGAGDQQAFEFVRIEKCKLGLGHLVGSQTIEGVFPLPLP